MRHDTLRLFQVLSNLSAGFSTPHIVEMFLEMSEMLHSSVFSALIRDELTSLDFVVPHTLLGAKRQSLRAIASYPAEQSEAV